MEVTDKRDMLRTGSLRTMSFLWFCSIGFVLMASFFVDRDKVYDGLILLLFFGACLVGSFLDATRPKEK